MFDFKERRESNQKRLLWLCEMSGSDQAPTNTTSVFETEGEVKTDESVFTWGLASSA